MTEALHEDNLKSCSTLEEDEMITRRSNDNLCILGDQFALGNLPRVAFFGFILLWVDGPIANQLTVLRNTVKMK